LFYGSATGSSFELHECGWLQGMLPGMSQRVKNSI